MGCFDLEDGKSVREGEGGPQKRGGMAGVEVGRVKVSGFDVFCWTSQDSKTKENIQGCREYHI